MKRIIIALVFCIATNVFCASKVIESQIRSAHKTYESKVSKAKTAYIKVLDNAIKSYTKKGLLDDALRIKKFKEDLGMKDEIDEELSHVENGKIQLTSLEPIFTKLGWGKFEINRRDSTPLINNKLCTDFIFAHASSLISYDIPKGTKYFKAIACSKRSKSIVFKVIIDGKTVYESKPLAKYRKKIAKVKVKIPIGAKQIDLVTDSLGDRRHDDSCWAYPEFIVLQ